MRQSRSRIIKSGLYVLTIIILVYVVVYMPTPYMINQPGTAEEIKPMVTVQDADPEEKGTFMLTTVSVSYANLAMLVTSQFNTHAEIIRKEPDRDEKEYATEQKYYMSSSQSNAIVAAYNQADVPYEIVPEYVFIVGLSKTIQTKGDFLPGDIFTKVNGASVGRLEDLASLLKGKKVGETVSVELKRDGKILNQQVELVEIGGDSETTKAGLGVSIGEVRKVMPNESGKEVKFANTRIGGPSAGLMFTLEIYNQLTSGDLSKGYRIAGTGTMSVDGTVGPIGGVQFKIVASDREHAEIFFVPESNYNDAKAKAEAIGSKMTLVPVKNVDDALKYLEELPPKA
ncbi:PDZ domain-containing protein [Paenibacillus anaericanus]|uniref:endopeptidase La n=1 Tax=Paenibacillus anaericanus TaxID=170367 RepID=A0A3S1DQS1_9BACL|nr:SepM family pheromone-processing serine protease [Paenibacillus anaericanus]RUT46945.1 PDZ domain-containing protein [Paenibacillus anaericanus]